MNLCGDLADLFRQHKDIPSSIAKQARTCVKMYTFIISRIISEEELDSSKVTKHLPAATSVPTVRWVLKIVTIYFTLIQGKGKKAAQKSSVWAWANERDSAIAMLGGAHFNQFCAFSCSHSVIRITST